MPAITNYTNEPFEERKVSFPGQYRYIDAYIEKGGEQFFVADKIIGFNYYESLELPYLTFEVVMMDSTNIPSALKILGGEKFVIHIEDCHEDERVFEFNITKISDRKPLSVSSMSYTIHGTTENVIYSQIKKISRSYINQKPELIIEDVLRTDLNFDVSKFFYDVGRYELCCVLPNWRGIDAINWVNSRNQSSQYARSPYKTFMTSDQEIYHMPLDMLYSPTANVSRGDLKIKINRLSPEEIRVLDDARMTEHLYSFTKFEQVKTAELIENLTMGMFLNRSQEVDLFNRDSTDRFHNYERDFSATLHLGDLPYSIENIDLSNFDIDSPHWRTTIRHPGLFSQEDVNSKPEYITSDYLSKNQQTQNYKVKGVLPASFELRVGQKYNIDVPRFAEASTVSDIQTVDELMSGEFILEKIKHSFSPDVYTARCLFFKDALEDVN